MLAESINYFNRILGETGLFSRLMGLCEIVERNGVKYPAQWYKQEYKRAVDYDKHNGFGYWRKTGPVTQSLETSARISNEKIITTTYPLRLVIVVPVKKLGKYGRAYRNDIIGEQITKKLVNTHSNFRNSIGAKTLNLMISSYTDDRLTIQQDEFKEINPNIRYEFIYMAFDMNLQITLPNSCLKDICDNETVADFDILDFNSKDFFV